MGIELKKKMTGHDQVMAQKKDEEMRFLEISILRSINDGDEIETYEEEIKRYIKLSDGFASEDRLQMRRTIIASLRSSENLYLQTIAEQIESI